MPPNLRLPFGTQDLDPRVVFDPGPPRRVRCYVQGCNHWLQTPTQADRGEVCPAHGIRCHHSSYGSTYTYLDARRNITVDPDVLATRIVGHPFKYESHRLGYERSEDALTWNVFRSLQATGRLHQVARRITGLDVTEEPRLFLWGIELTGDSFAPWDLLIAARARFESRLPVVRPRTEPDIALFQAGLYLVLIEAKFTSPNTFYENGPRADARSLTKNELIRIYHDPALRILDTHRAAAADLVYYQLWRNMVFAEWMARSDESSTEAYHASLTRAGFEVESCAHFRRMVRDEFSQRFVHLTWEELVADDFPATASAGHLRRYIATKTASLVAAFSSGTSAATDLMAWRSFPQPSHQTRHTRSR
jgi:hypothetical protein